MSRHTLPSSNPHIEIVVGYDRPLRHWYGQIFDHEGVGPLDDEKIIDGWPNKDGLIGPFNMRMNVRADAVRKLDIMMTWLAGQPHSMTQDQFVQLQTVLLLEWEGKIDPNYNRTWE